MTKTKEIQIEGIPHILIPVENGSQNFILKGNVIHYEIPYKDIFTGVELRLSKYEGRLNEIIGKDESEQHLIVKLYE